MYENLKMSAPIFKLTVAELNAVTRVYVDASDYLIGTRESYGPTAQHIDYAIIIQSLLR